MDRKNLIITGSIAGIIVILLGIGMLMFPNSASGDNYESDNLTNLYGLYSTDENSDTEPGAEEDVFFDNSTPEKTAISIARLNEGMIGFDSHITTSASLTPDGKYWVVKMHNVQDVNDEITVTVDAKTLMSKRDKSEFRPATAWRSLDELKAAYIAELQSGNGYDIGKPNKIALEWKTVWKVPLYDITNGEKLIGYIYVDLATGKSKNVDLKGNTEGWLTLKEVDKFMDYGDAQYPPFKDALRNLYPE